MRSALKGKALILGLAGKGMHCRGLAALRCVSCQISPPRVSCVTPHTSTHTNEDAMVLCGLHWIGAATKTPAKRLRDPDQSEVQSDLNRNCCGVKGFRGELGAVANTHSCVKERISSDSCKIKFSHEHSHTNMFLLSLSVNAV